MTKEINLGSGPGSVGGPKISILFVALHKPKGPREEAIFVKALADYGNMQRRYPGLESYSVGKDEKTGLLVVVSKWASREAMAAAGPEMQRFKDNFDFKANQDGPTRFWTGEAQFLEPTQK